MSVDWLESWRRDIEAQANRLEDRGCCLLALMALEHLVPLAELASSMPSGVGSHEVLSLVDSMWERQRKQQDLGRDDLENADRLERLYEEHHRQFPSYEQLGSTPMERAVAAAYRNYLGSVFPIAWWIGAHPRDRDVVSWHLTALLATPGYLAPGWGRGRPDSEGRCSNELEAGDPISMALRQLWLGWARDPRLASRTIEVDRLYEDARRWRSNMRGVLSDMSKRARAPSR